MKNATLMTFLATLALGAGAAFAEANPIYLKADATGEGTGENWANALTSIDDAVALADSTGRPVYAAAGFYQRSAVYTCATYGLTFYGGFPGVSDSETPDDCDSATYQTIVSPTAVGTYKWNHAVPDDSALTFAVSALDAAQYPVFTTDANGRTVFTPPPAHTDDFDTYYLSGGDGGFFLDINYEKSLFVSGVWFVGFLEGAFKINTSTRPAVAFEISDCRFFGGKAVEKSADWSYSETDKLTLRIADSFFGYVYNRGPVIRTYSWGTLVEDCQFSDFARSAAETGSELIYAPQQYATVRGCTFRR